MTEVYEMKGGYGKSEAQVTRSYQVAEQTWRVKKLVIRERRMELIHEVGQFIW